MTNHARRLGLAVAALTLAAVVLAIYPFRLTPVVPHDDAVAHLLAGMAIGTTGTLATTRADHTIAVAALALGIGWEVVEGWWFKCLHPAPLPCPDELWIWFLMEDTLFDIALVVLGAVVALIAVGRYR